ncbi:MAG: hypothetical protein H6581_22920 [Bacteroidia bacterium]|nr:hypothetical protein [Bacteroidia bacterium]
MNIQAEISWIKSELDKVNDPYLIEIFKNLLKYRDNALRNEMDRMILEAEDDIKNGRILSGSELKSEMDSWRK